MQVRFGGRPSEKGLRKELPRWWSILHLYDLEEGWGIPREKGRYSAKMKEGNWFRWDPPLLPGWALPEAQRNERKKKPPEAPLPNGNGTTVLATQHQLIKTLAAELGLDVDRDILAKMKINWPPNKADAERIVKRLNEMKQATAQAKQ